MTVFKHIIFLSFFHTYFCETSINNLFTNINENTLKFNQISAEIAWESSVNPGNIELSEKAARYQKDRITWQQSTCDMLATLLENNDLLNSTQRRQAYLLCRGSKFTFEEAREMSNFYKQLMDIYNAEICIPNVKNIPIKDVRDKEFAIHNYLSTFKKGNNEKLRNFTLTKDQTIMYAVQLAANQNISDFHVCLKGEVYFDEIMKSSRKEEVLRFTWLAWRERTGLCMKKPYRRLVDIENMAARRNGYQNIGGSWRDELEIPNLREFCRQLYENVRPLYALLHGVIRFHLRRFYGNIVSENGPIPAHLLGNLWSQNWEHLSDLLVEEDINLDQKIKKLNRTVTYMVKRAEDYYQSLGLPSMTHTFWRESVFSGDNNAAMCHGAAADMFKDDDFRLLYCSGANKDDFYVIHHELGHIHYYMAYQKQPALFRQANSVLHETIGDTIMYGVLSPQHLHRLGLITDNQLYESTSNRQDDSKEKQNEITLDTKLKQIETGLNVYSKSVDNKNFGSLINQMFEGNEDSESKNDVLRNINYKLDRDRKISKHSNSYKNFHKHTNVNVLPVDKKLQINRFDNPKDVNFQRNLNTYWTKDTDLVRNKRFMTFYKKSGIKMKLTTDEMLLLKQALNKIPLIPFALLIDEYRWKYFEGSLTKPNQNFWEMSLELQGISPPNSRGEEYFDAGAKFHVPDNTPYIRYFLSSFLQHQLFQTLCKTAVFGRKDAKEALPETISLNRCDLYGSKAAGKVLKDIMSRGHSQHWREILKSTVNISEITSDALHRYYQPLQRLLLKHVQKYDIPIGW